MTQPDPPLPAKAAGALRIFRAFRHSLEGMASALKHERAFRQEMILGLMLIPVAIILPVGLIGAALMISSLLLVLMFELANSAVEWVVDYISLERHPYAKRAKDMASAAVFLSLTNALTVWGLVIAHHWGTIRPWAESLGASA